MKTYTAIVKKEWVGEYYGQKMPASQDYECGHRHRSKEAAERCGKIQGGVRRFLGRAVFCGAWINFEIRENVDL